MLNFGIAILKALTFEGSVLTQFDCGWFNLIYLQNEYLQQPIIKDYSLIT